MIFFIADMKKRADAQTLYVESFWIASILWLLLVEEVYTQRLFEAFKPKTQ